MTATLTPPTVHPLKRNPAPAQHPVDPIAEARMARLREIAPDLASRRGDYFGILPVALNAFLASHGGAISLTPSQREELEKLKARWNEFNQKVYEATEAHHRRGIKLASRELAGAHTEANREKLRALTFDPRTRRGEKQAGELARAEFVKGAVFPWFVGFYKVAASRLDAAVTALRKSESLAAQKSAVPFSPSLTLLGMQLRRLDIENRIKLLVSPPHGHLFCESPAMLEAELGLKTE